MASSARARGSILTFIICAELHVRLCHRRYIHACLQVVNKTEVEAMLGGGVPFFAINLAVGISLAIPGFQTDIAKGLLHALPQA